MELSIDTSTSIASIALSHQGVIRSEATWDAGTNHTVQLLPAVQAMLKAAGSNTAQISAVFVALGPGSFAGIRVALSTAKGMAVSLSIPLIGISTLEFEAYPFAYSGLPVTAIHEAGRSELAVATYQEVDGQWMCLSPHQLVTMAGLCESTTSKTIFCGEMSSLLEMELRHRLEDLAVIPQSVARLRRAGNLAVLGWQRLRHSGSDDPVTLQPIYMRHPHITIPKARD